MVHAPLVLEAGDARLTVDPAIGGRMTSLRIAGHEILATEGDGPLHWGCYPMTPFAGRIRHGRFTFAGHEVRLPLNLPPHAIHGTVHERAWEVVGPDTLAIDLGPDWPFAGRAHQRFTLRHHALEAELTLEADEAMPGMVGWHPWFRRVLAGTAAAPRPPSPPVELRFEAGRMYRRDLDGLPTGELVAPTTPPWDDCFTDVVAPPRLRWPGVLSLEIRSSCDHWVVYTEPEEALCVEPQSGPPDAVHLVPQVVEPGAPLRAWMTWGWSPDAG